MIDGKRVLGVVVARGGSKGLPRKNVLPAAGKPLIAWTIDAAKDSALLDRVILSTDDDEIAAVAAAHGCDVPFKRPPELATDTASIYDVLFHAIDQAGPDFDMVVLLQATSPARIAADIDGAIALCLEKAAPACVSLCEPSKAPHWMFTLGEGGALQPLMGWQPFHQRRQDLPVAYAVNGAVYVADIAWLRSTGNFYAPETVAWIMPPERSVDIDTAFDLAMFEALRGQA